MRILLVNQFFWPDHAATAQIATDLASDLASSGMEVTVVASRGSYLGGQRFPRRDALNGVTIRRLASTSLGKRRLTNAAIDYASFFATAAAELALLPRSDAAILMTTPPLLAAAGLVAKALRGTPLVYWIQDLYPDVAVALGALRRESLAARALSAASRLVLRRADAAVVLGEAMRDRVVAAGARPDRVHVVPNWADGRAIRPIEPADNPTRTHLLAAAAPSEREPCLVMYSGNMGRGHDLELLVEAARRLATRDDLRFVFVGDGAKRRIVEAAARELKNVSLAPYQPRHNLAESLSAGDVHLVSLAPELAGLVEPSKLYGIMAAGRPAVFVGPRSAEVARTIERERAGVVVEAGDADALVRALAAYADDPDARAAAGASARAALLARYDRQLATGAFARVLASL